VVDKVLGQAPVVEVRELFEHQAGHQLGLGKLLEAVLVTVRRKGPAGGFVSDLQYPARGFARSHISYYMARSCQVRGISTEQVALLFCPQGL
jgi:hypothetical protein